MVGDAQSLKVQVENTVQCCICVVFSMTSHIILCCIHQYRVLSYAGMDRIQVQIQKCNPHDWRFLSGLSQSSIKLRLGDGAPLDHGGGNGRSPLLICTGTKGVRDTF